MQVTVTLATLPSAHECQHVLSAGHASTHSLSQAPNEMGAITLLISQLETEAQEGSTTHKFTYSQWGTGIQSQAFGSGGVLSPQRCRASTYVHHVFLSPHLQPEVPWLHPLAALPHLRPWVHSPGDTCRHRRAGGRPETCVAHLHPQETVWGLEGAHKYSLNKRPLTSVTITQRPAASSPEK